MPNFMRKKATMRNTPTPTATVMMSVMSGTAGTWRASTCRSGSATVTAMPMARHTPMMRNVLFDWESFCPMAWPMGIMATSAPRVKRPVPAMRSAAPRMKRSNVPMGMGAIVNDRISTIAVIGRTAASDSRSLDLNACLNRLTAFLGSEGNARGSQSAVFPVIPNCVSFMQTG